MDSANKVLFLGSKLLGLRSLQTLYKLDPHSIAGVVTLADEQDVRTVLMGFKDFCANAKLPLVVVEKPSELARIIRHFVPFCVLVVGWYWIFPDDLLDLVTGGFFGVHASLLPKYRGNAPLVWSILQGEKKTGVTLFKFDKGMDTGSIVGQTQFAINTQDSIADALQKAENATIELIENLALLILRGDAPLEEQNHDQASYCSLRRPEDGLIDWTKPAEEIYDFIRAQTRPYPGAFTYLPDGTLLRIWRASLFPYPFYGIPGLVGQKYQDGIVVSCGKGALIILDFESALQGGQAFVDLKWGLRLGARG